METPNWQNIKEKLEKNVQEILDRYKSLPIYFWQLQGEIIGMSDGHGWSVNIHFEDDYEIGGVKYINLGHGEQLTQELAKDLKIWFEDICEKHPGKLENRLEISENT